MNASDTNRIRNGVPATSLGRRVQWRKPWSNPSGGNCVEALVLPDRRVALRQSTDPTGPALIFGAEDIAAFVQGVKDGQADFLLEDGTRRRPAPTGA